MNYKNIISKFTILLLILFILIQYDIFSRKFNIAREVVVEQDRIITTLEETIAHQNELLEDYHTIDRMVKDLKKSLDKNGN